MVIERALTKEESSSPSNKTKPNFSTKAIALTTPFASTHSPVYAALAVARHGERPPLPPLPSDVSSLIERGWSQDAAARPTAHEMQASVEAILAKKESFGSLEMSARLAGDATTASA
mgnify:CR=1 FL=1